MKYIVSIILCLLAPPLFAQEALIRQINVQGEAVKNVVPDQAELHFTIESKDRKLEEVKRLQDEKLQKLYQLAGELQIEKKHLRTHSMQLEPEYRYHEGKQIFQGYRGSVRVMMMLSDTEKVADALQKLVDADLGSINNMRYSVKDEEALRDALLGEALKNAKEKASRMASALGMALGAPIQIAESGVSMPQPVMRHKAMMEAASLAAEPMAPPVGEEEIRAQVSVSFEMIKEPSAKE